MSKIIIRGGKRLHGCVDIAGAKNAVLPIMAASLLNSSVTVINNCPDIEDVRQMAGILKYLGCIVKRKDSSIIIDTKNAVNATIPGSISGKLRASSILIGPLMARFSSVKLAPPGGCDIGERPMDIHLNALKRLGAFWSLGNGYIELSGRLKSNEVDLRFPSVGATENVIMASVFLAGTTIIYNAAKEPDVVQLCRYLNEAGAYIKGAGTDTIVINGVDKLHLLQYNIDVDRIVAGTYIGALAVCGGSIRLNNCHFKDLKGFIDVYCGIGVRCVESEAGICVFMNKRPDSINYIKTQPYPGFPTDMQSIIMSVLSIADGKCIIQEDIYENRYKTAYELIKMGADIRIKEKCAYIKGVKGLIGKNVIASDLRGGAALIIAGLNAMGITVIEKAEYISRGYDDVCGNLRKLGADIIWQDN